MASAATKERLRKLRQKHGLGEYSKGSRKRRKGSRKRGGPSGNPYAFNESYTGFTNLLHRS